MISYTISMIVFLITARFYNHNPVAYVCGTIWVSTTHIILSIQELKGKKKK